MRIGKRGAATTAISAARLAEVGAREGDLTRKIFRLAAKAERAIEHTASFPKEVV